MKMQELIKLEDQAKEVWVISPSLHYDTDNKDFSELVSVNLGEKTKYRYIVPATDEIERNILRYQQLYNATDEDISTNFLILPSSEFLPFITECAIYNASTDCIACAAPATEDDNEVLQYTQETAYAMAAHFKKVWLRYKRCEP